MRYHVVIEPRPACRSGHAVNHHVHVVGPMRGAAQIRAVLRAHPPSRSSYVIVRMRRSRFPTYGGTRFTASL